MEKRTKELEALIAQETARLHEICGMSRDHAEKLLMERLERELTDEIAKRIQRFEDRLRPKANRKAEKYWPLPFSAMVPATQRIRP